jgi:hypothetical protein
MVLTGSIVRRDFPWETIIARRHWVHAVRHERARGDCVVRLAAAFARMAGPLAPRAGASGADGFIAPPPQVRETSVAGGHSEVLHIANYDRWARFIAYPQLPADHLRVVQTLVQQIRALAAAELELDPALVRANVFVPEGGVLRMLRGAWDNMMHAPEHDITLRFDHGSTGRAFSDGTPFSIRRRASGWTAGVLPGPQQARLHPRLQWVLSLPIGRLVTDDQATVARDVVGVLNVDGLDTVPAMLQTPGDTALKTLVFALWATTERIRQSLALAETGEPLHDD